MSEKTSVKINKSTQSMQTSAKAAHYPNIDQIPNLESLHGDLDRPYCHCRTILKCSSKSTHYLLSYGRISSWSHHGDPDHYQYLITCAFHHPRPPARVPP